MLSLHSYVCYTHGMHVETLFQLKANNSNSEYAHCTAGKNMSGIMAANYRYVEHGSVMSRGACVLNLLNSVLPYKGLVDEVMRSW